MEYNAEFYSGRRKMTQPAAEKILPILMQLASVRSVADFGCGIGVWLSVARTMGATRTIGFEGEWVTTEMLENADIDLKRGSLEKRVQLDEPVDLAISLEVAEHLSAVRADSFVDDLCAASSLILFSAAVPGQGGKGHVNEQWQSYWAEKFGHHGYRIFDIVRPQIWGDAEIPYWYQQNTMVLIREGHVPVSLQGCDKTPAQMDLVHKKLLERIHTKSLSFFGRLRAKAGRKRAAL